DGGVVFEEMAEIGGDGRHLVCLDSEQHEIVRTSLLHARSRGACPDDLPSVLQLHLHPAAADPFQVRSPGNESDLLARGREQATQVPTDSPGSNYRNFHGDYREVTDIRLSTAIATIAATTFIAAPTTNTDPHPRDAAITPDIGTSNEAAPLA